MNQWAMYFRKVRFVFTLAVLAAIVAITLSHLPSSLVPSEVMAQTNQEHSATISTEAFQESDYAPSESQLRETLRNTAATPTHSKPPSMENSSKEVLFPISQNVLSDNNSKYISNIECSQEDSGKVNAEVTAARMAGCTEYQSTFDKQNIPPLFDRQNLPIVDEPNIPSDISLPEVPLADEAYREGNYSDAEEQLKRYIGPTAVGYTPTSTQTVDYSSDDNEVFGNSVSEENQPQVPESIDRPFPINADENSAPSPLLDDTPPQPSFRVPTSVDSEGFIVETGPISDGITGLPVDSGISDLIPFDLIPLEPPNSLEFWLSSEELSLGNAHRKLGDIYLLQEEYDNALSSYEKARDILIFDVNLSQGSSNFASGVFPCYREPEFTVYVQRAYDLSLSAFELSKIFDALDREEQKAKVLAISESVLAELFSRLPIFRYTAPVLPLINRDDFAPSFVDDLNDLNLTPIDSDTAIYSGSGWDFRKRTSSFGIGVVQNLGENVSLTVGSRIDWNTRNGRIRPGLDLGFTLSLDNIFNSIFSGPESSPGESNNISNTARDLNVEVCFRDLPDQIESRITKLLQQVLVAQGKYESALLISEAGRTVAVDKVIAAYLEEVNPERANFVLDLVAALGVDDYSRVAYEEQATLVNYSVISDEKIYVWVLQPDGTLIFKEIGCNSLSVNSSNVEICDLLRGEIQDIPFVSDSDRGRARLSYTIVRDLRLALGVGAFSSRDRQTLSDLSFSEQRLKDLYKLLIYEIEDLLPPNENKHIVLIPDGSLFFVPFPALQKEDGSYLIDHHTIRIAPNLRSLVLSHQQYEPIFNEKNALVAANPMAMQVPLDISGQGNFTELPKLPWTEAEAVTVRNILAGVREDRIDRQESFNVDLYSGGITRENVLNALNEVSVAHFAMHGLIDSSSTVQCDNARSNEISPYPFDQAITHCTTLNPNPKLIPGQLITSDSISSTDRSNWLSALDFLRMDLSETDLVVLSACDTALGQTIPGGVVGLPFSLNLAGVRSTVASIWSVTDSQATVDFMSNFYGQMLQEHEQVDVARALRLAMLITKEEYPEPKYWAGFALSGAAR